MQKPQILNHVEPLIHLPSVLAEITMVLLLEVKHK